MKYAGLINHLSRFFYKNPNIDIDEMIKTLEGSSAVGSDDSLKAFRNEFIELSDVLNESINIIRNQGVSKKEPRPKISEILVTDFYKILNVSKSTFNSWKQKGYFQNNLGSERKKIIPVSDIDEFFQDSRFRKYKSIWENYVRGL